MNKPPLWFVVVTVVALLWNAAGLVAVVTDLRLSAADIAALPADQQALYAARPAWSVAASLLAVAAGTLGCLLLLLRKRWAALVFAISLVGVIVQDLGIFVVAGAGKSGSPVPFVLQGSVLLVAIALLLLARSANRKSWLT
jgi:hypothetical protein